MHGSGLATALLETWSPPGQVERLRCERARTYMKHAVTCNLTFITFGSGVWEDANNISSSTATRSLLQVWSCWLDQNRSKHPLEWISKWHATTATSSGDAEALEWSSAEKAGIRLTEFWEFSPIGQSEMDPRKNQTTAHSGCWLNVEAARNFGICGNR